MQEQEVDPLGWRISDSVVRGEIDSRERDRVTGRIWLLDREFPIEITLRGNPMRDIAGCLLVFENPDPMPEDNEGLSPVQMGVPGIITASRKERVLDVITPETGAPELEAVQKIGNAIWIEWFSNANGRVVIHATDFLYTISDYAWRMKPEEEQNQITNSEKAHQQWKEVVASENGEFDDDPDDFEDSGWYMDEFEWERQFQESDALSSRYMLLMETYLNHPNRENIIAHEMGWNSSDLPDEDGEDEDGNPFDWIDEDDDESEWDDFDFDDTMTPIPETEGIDWIRTEDGRIRHPLSQRATDVVQSIWRVSKDLATGPEDPGSDLQAMLFHAQTLNAKLSGALDSLAYDDAPDGGFVVACLKRALQSFALTIKALGSVAQQNLLPSSRVSAFRDELFFIRQEILRLMHHYRHISDI
jgi:hypothetical protein